MTPLFHEHVHVCLCVGTHTRVHGGQRSTLGVIPQELYTWIFEIGLLLDVKIVD